MHTIFTMADTISLFEDFLRTQKRDIEIMQFSLRHGGHVQFLIRPLRVKASDITWTRNFSSANIEFGVVEDFLPCSVRSLFKTGYRILDDFFSSDPDKPVLPEDPRCKHALQLLLAFLTYSRKVWETLYKDEENHMEWKWSLKLAQHVFSKLSLNPAYKYDINIPFTTDGYPCQEDDAMIGVKSDTSFGWEEGWHGRADIIMAGVPVMEIENIEDDSASRSSEGSSVSIDIRSSVSCEVKTNNPGFTLSDYSQIGAETIAFSFLKNKGKTNEVSMIPSIAVNHKTVQVHFYDSVNDVFLQSNPVELAQDNAIRHSAILLIWFALNYELFYTGIQGTFPRSGLHDISPVEKLSETVKAPCILKRDGQDRSILDSDWCDTNTYTDED